MIDASYSDVATTRAWSTTTPEAAEALALITETHAVCPLPAYDKNGVIIEPRAYGCRLEGVMVIIRFELNHYVIRNKKHKNDIPTDAFSARVIQLRVIIPPPAAHPVTPQKRNLLPSNNYFGAFTPHKNFKKDEDGSDEEKGGPSANTVGIGVFSHLENVGNMS